jgi:hypothetical protein
MNARLSATASRRRDPVSVAFWIDGTLRSRSRSAGATLRENMLRATVGAVNGASIPVRPQELTSMRIEIDVLGVPRRFGARTAAEFEQALEPGIHGVAAARDGHRSWVASSVAITRNLRTHELLSRLCEEGGWPPDAYVRGDVRLSRFRSRAFIDSSSIDAAHELLRGNCPIGAEDWSRERVARAIDDAARYLTREQRSDGAFTYGYDASRSAELEGDHIVRQLATMWIVAEVGARPAGGACRAVIQRALPYITARLRHDSVHRRSLAVSEHGGPGLLASSAFALLALVATGEPALGAAARGLAEGILALQRPDGGFHTEFPGVTRREQEDFSPGEALLALMALHARDPDRRYAESVRRALPTIATSSGANGRRQWRRGTWPHMRRCSASAASARTPSSCSSWPTRRCPRSTSAATFRIPITSADIARDGRRGSRPRR